MGGFFGTIPKSDCQKKNFVHIVLTVRATFNDKYVIL